MLRFPRVVPMVFALSLLPWPLQAQTQALPEPVMKSQTRVKHQLRLAQRYSLETEIQGIDHSAAAMDAELALHKAAQNFRVFIVDPRHIVAILLGLQQGESVDLQSPASGQLVHVVKATPAMSLGNAYVALSLAKLDLARYDILQPTYEQLQKAFHGGSFVQSRLQGNRKIQLSGVLKQYAHSRNWGQIAQRLGVAVEPLRYDMQSTAVALADRQAVPTTFTSLQPRRQGAEKARAEQADAL